MSSTAAAGEAAASYPVQLDARLDEPLSRWLWLVKWFLAIPHWIVLALLWVVFILLTIVAWFAILFTGRYPRAIFDFNVGVMRWTWRVEYYATTVLGTDRYPPFTLGEVPDYPATLDVPYPERLSRGLIFVKSWLLALPQLLIVGIFAGGWGVRFFSPGLIGVLSLIGIVIYAFRQRYPTDLFQLILGLCRWTWRVCAYVALMRDEYPPFRLEP